MTENNPNILIPFGRDAQGIMRRPSEVPNGIACGCFCASCGKRLISKQGQILVWHFAHQGDPCPFAGETAVHQMAKQIILQAATVTVPDLIAYHPNGRPHRCFQPEQPIQLTNCQPEALWRGFRPDILSDQLAIEIHVTHATTDDKRAAFAEHSIAAIEITLPTGIENQPDFSEIVLHTARRSWLFHPRQDEINAQAAEEARQLEIERQERLAQQRAEAERAVQERAQRNAEEAKQALERFKAERSERISSVIAWACSYYPTRSVAPPQHLFAAFNRDDIISLFAQCPTMKAHTALVDQWRIRDWFSDPLCVKAAQEAGQKYSKYPQ